MSKERIWRVTDQTELSLALSSSIDISGEKAASISSSESNGNTNKWKRKRKHLRDEPRKQRSIELHLDDDPLPPAWEQCLDLQSGKMYYLNRKTLKKRWMKPMTKERELDLNLNIWYTSTSSSEEKKLGCSSVERAEKNQNNSSDRSCGMITTVCINCHLLVMLCELWPSCPNCKHIHSQQLPSLPLPSTSPEPAAVAVESLKTLSLLHALDVSLTREARS
ncbi:uncharacterized protein LOC141820262 [Curcuma longa]|uniref:uncharacterized protein LOC141820262 n=1 Tax=Curcuma longa TaxID=136217 RepID=UPI003D9F7D81